MHARAELDHEQFTILKDKGCGVGLQDSHFNIENWFSGKFSKLLVWCPQIARIILTPSVSRRWKCINLTTSPVPLPPDI